VSIIQYTQDRFTKTFDVAQALHDGEWGITLEMLPSVQCLRLIDRNNPEHHVTVSRIEYTRWAEMYIVSYAEGGWQCLDHAIEQFAIAQAKGETKP